LDDIDLLYDFTQTAKAFKEGKDFMARFYDASERGELF
jgi:hypothetical protein